MALPWAWLAPKFAVECKLLADVFLKLIKMMIAPVVFCTLVVGIAGSRASGWQSRPGVCSSR